MKILITGGAGYIGSTAVKELCNNHDVIVIDNLSKGQKNSIDDRASFYEGDLVDSDFLESVFFENEIDAVIHFAAYKSVEESMCNPEKYKDNVIGTQNLLAMMKKHNVPKIVFSSTAAVYGITTVDKVTEETELAPINIYGEGKLQCEKLITNSELDYVILRYFNVAGDGGLRFLEKGAKNIFPILTEVLNGKREKLSIFGNDYNTPDGTCLRDYIHILDLVDAHILALTHSESDIFNLGTSNGYSVLDVLGAFEKASGKRISYEITGRREGDPETILANATKANMKLNWHPRRSLEDMVSSVLSINKND